MTERTWSVTGAEKRTGRPASRAPASIRSRQSLWISPERYAAFDAGYAAALGKPIVTLHDGDLDHALKEVDRAAQATARTAEQVVDVLRYVIRGELPR